MSYLESRIKSVKRDVRSFNEGVTYIVMRDGALEDVHALQSALAQARQTHEAIQMLIGLLTAEELRKMDIDAARSSDMHPKCVILL